MMGHLNSFSATGGGNLNKNFPKIQMPGGFPGGMFKFRFHLTGALRVTFLPLTQANKTRFLLPSRTSFHISAI